MPNRPISRRTFLATGLAGLAVGACSLNNPYRNEVEDEPVDPDQEAVKVVRTATLETLTVISSLIGAWPALASEAAPLVRLHTEHLSRLSDQAPHPPDATPRTAATLAAARQELRIAEESLREVLLTQAAHARSGRLARVLGSMRAAIGQQVLA